MAVVPIAKVIPLHSSSTRATAARRAAGRRAAVARTHPSQLADSHERASAKPIAAAVRDAAGEHATADDARTALHRRITGVADFIHTRMTGDYTVDEFGFDPHLNDAIFLPLLRRVFRSWFRVQVSGIENLPPTGAALIVANHAGVLPMDALMTSVAVHDKHPTHRDLRLLAADMVLHTPSWVRPPAKPGTPWPARLTRSDCSRPAN